MQLACAAPLALGTSSLLEACSDIEPSQPDAMRQQVLRDLVAKIIVPTYADLVAAAADLTQASKALAGKPSPAHLEAAQRAFRTARGYWKNAEAFYFGPAEDLALTGGAIDSWPADSAAIEDLLASNAALDLDAVMRLGANKRGFPAIEQLLFDSRDEDAVLDRFTDADVGARRVALLTSLARDLEDKCQAVHDAWAKGSENFGHELAEAGVDSKKYARQRDGIDEVVTGLLYLAELILMSKLAKPLGLDTGNGIAPQLEEAPRSDGSLRHLRENLLGMQAVYLCRRGKVKGVSLSSAVRDVNASVDTRLKKALADALAAVDAVPDTFRIALVADKKSLEDLYEKVRVLKNVIVMDLAGALGASIGFGYSDTD